MVSLEDFSSFKISKHPGTMGNVLAAVNSVSGQVQFFSEDREILSEFLHSDPDQEGNVSIAIRSFNIIEGDWLAILTLSDGRIYRASVEEFSVDSFTFEQVGAVEGGLSAAEWSPDYTILVLITGINRRILLSRDFEPIEEGLVQVEDFGSEEMISIGWGKKETQFHGTLGKSAAINVGKIKMEPVEGDDGNARISWRADGNYFALSILEKEAGRRIRVYDRTGNLLSTSEPIEGLEGPLAWRPNGSVIASVQFLRSQNKRQVVFFERNGLRHGEFLLPEGNRKNVADLFWSSDSNILAVVYVGNETELWSCSNYHWYLKKQLPIGPLKHLFWDPESLIISTITNVLSVFTLVWDQTVSDSCIVVVDGKIVHLTPLNLCNIPQPMSHTQLTFSSVPDVVTLKSLGNNQFKLAVSLCDGSFEIYFIKFSRKLSECETKLTSKLNLSDRFIQLESIVNDGFVVSNLKGTSLQIIANDDITTYSIQLPEQCLRILSNSGQVLLRDKTVHSFSESSLEFSGTVDNNCEWISHLTNENVYLSMSEKGWIWANDNLIMTQATSYVVTDQFILLTTHTHQLIFLPRGSVDQWESLARAALEAQSGNEELQRRVERGTLLVSAVIETSGVVLQMPRGNLETIHPRAMVLSSLRKHLNALEYHAAYAICRSHRIDLNILHDHAPELFIQTIGKFVKDLDSVDHLNIFLSSLRDEDVSKTKYAGFNKLNILNNQKSAFIGKINSVSEAILSVLQGDSLNWIDSIITVFVVQQPARLEDALNCIIELAESGQSAEIIEKSMKYLLFLVPADKLFDVALGMYQLPLALSIGRRSQKDPKDFEPFLEELAAINVLRRNFKINDHLQRYPAALKCLFEDSNVGSDEFLAYMEKYQLYREAVEISSSNPNLYKSVLDLFGEHLMTSTGGNHVSAVCCFKRSGNWTRVIDCSVIAGSWIEFIDACKRMEMAPEELLIDKMITTLKSQGRQKEVIQFCRFAGVADQVTIKLAIELGLFSDAVLIQPELSETFLEALNSHGQQLLARLNDLAADFTGKSERILKIQRSFLIAKPANFENENHSFSNNKESEGISDNISEMSFRTSNTTIKTRTTNTSRRSVGSSKKAERNRTRDRPGSPHEREFLLFNIRELIGQTYKLASVVFELLKNLVQFNDERDSPLILPRSISNSYKSLCENVIKFVEEFRKIEVPRVNYFNGNGQAVNEQGNLIENPLIDPLEAKFELPSDFGLPGTWSIKLF